MNSSVIPTLEALVLSNEWLKLRKLNYDQRMHQNRPLFLDDTQKINVISEDNPEELFSQAL